MFAIMDGHERPIQWNVKLRILATLCGDSQRDLARKAGVNAGTLNRWLSGQHEPAITQAIGLARAYGLTLDQLFDPDIPLPTKIVREFEIAPPEDVIEKCVREAASGRPLEPGQPPAASQEIGGQKFSKVKRHRK